MAHGLKKEIKEKGNADWEIHEKILISQNLSVQNSFEQNWDWSNSKRIGTSLFFNKC